MYKTLFPFLLIILLFEIPLKGQDILDEYIQEGLANNQQIIQNINNSRKLVFCSILPKHHFPFITLSIIDNLVYIFKYIQKI